MNEMQRHSILDRLAGRLSAAGLPAEWYTIPAYQGFAALTGGMGVDVHCIEARLGSAPGYAGYSSYAVAHIFLPGYPTLALTSLVELSDVDRRPGSRPAKFGPTVDRKFSAKFLPAMFSGLNDLDPSGGGRGVLVQSYNAEMTTSDLFYSTVYSLWLVTRFKRHGQLALIAVDYYDPLTVLIANGLRRLRRIIPDIHLVPRTAARSTVKIPVRRPGDGHYIVDGGSTALDEGFALARAYLDEHYRSSMPTPRRSEERT